MTVPNLPDIPAVLNNTASIVRTVFPFMPGIPPLLNNIATSVDTLFATSDLLNLGMFNFGQRQWGLYSGASSTLLFDSFVSIEYKQEWAISDYPIERGGFESYNKVQVPFNIRARFASGGTEENRAALLQSVARIAGDLKKYTIVTPEAIYQSCNVQHYDYRRTSSNGVGMIVIDLWLLQIRERVVEVTSESAAAPGQNMQYSITVIPRGHLVGEGASGSWPSSPVAPFVDNPLSPSGGSVFNNGYVSTFDSRFNAISPGVVQNDPTLNFRVF